MSRLIAAVFAAFLVLAWLPAGAQAPADKGAQSQMDKDAKKADKDAKKAEKKAKKDAKKAQKKAKKDAKKAEKDAKKAEKKGEPK